MGILPKACSLHVHISGPEKDGMGVSMPQSSIPKVPELPALDVPPKPKPRTWGKLGTELAVAPLVARPVSCSCLRTSSKKATIQYLNFLFLFFRTGRRE